MDKFPRTMVGGVSMPRMIIGTNWFLGFSHTSIAKDIFIKAYQTRKNLADILSVYLENGVDAIMGLPNPMLNDAINDAQDRTGRKMIKVFTPHFNIIPGADPKSEPGYVFDHCKEMGATFCMPHQVVTDALLDLMYQKIRDMDKYSKMIRERGMIPGLSTHSPYAITIADKTSADVETYISIYNAAGFMMILEADWVMRIIKQAQKPVMTIKPLGAGRLLPPVGLAFVWNTIRDQDMVTIGTTTVEEAKEVIELSLDFINKRIPENELQTTRSKKGLLKK